MDRVFRSDRAELSKLSGAIRLMARRRASFARGEIHLVTRRKNTKLIISQYLHRHYNAELARDHFLRAIQSEARHHITQTESRCQVPASRGNAAQPLPRTALARAPGQSISSKRLLA